MFINIKMGGGGSDEDEKKTKLFEQAINGDYERELTRLVSQYQRDLDVFKKSILSDKTVGEFYKGFFLRLFI